jgi:hypothetical protein
MAKRKTFLAQSRESDNLAAAIVRSMTRDKEILSVYRPGNPNQDRIHRSPASTLVIGGGNRSGKSVCGFTEFVSRVTGEPIFGLDNKPIPSRFYKAKEGDITRYWLVGYNLDHIGQTFYRMLFEPGMGGTFTVIYDPNEGRYVKWNENIPYHRENIDRRELSEPLIPSRLIREDSWTWNPYGGGQAKKCWSSVELTNGAILYAFPSTTPQPKQGDPIHGLLIDEDVATGGHVSEYLARLGDHSGWAIWPAWPHDENHVLSSLIDGCKLAMEKNDPRFEYILLTTLDNPFFTDKAIQLAMDRMRMVGDEEMVESRIFGIQGHETRKMYDFHLKRHGISGHLATRTVPDLPTTSRRGVLQDIYRRNGKFPDTWTRYLSVDPSTQRAAVVFGVVPPSEVNGVKMPPTLIIEHELIQRRSTPKGLALATREIVGTRNYEAFIMDKNFGRQRHWAAEGVATVEVLASEFRQLGLRSRSTNEWFVMGCNKPQDRYSAVRELLYADEECPALYVLIDTTPETQKEFDRYYKKQTEFKGMTVVEDEPENPRKFDCMAALEYLTHHFWTMMQVGRHFINPSAYGQDNTMAQVALAIASHDEHKAEYIHLGPGTKA